MTPTLEAGTVLTSGGRTITDVEIALLPAIMGAINPLFHDDVAASASRMNGRILYGPAALGIAVGLTEPFLNDIVLGLLEISQLRFLRPVKAGDTLTATLKVLSIEPREGRPGAVLTTADGVHNQRGEEVIAFSRKILVQHRQ